MPVFSVSKEQVKNKSFKKLNLWARLQQSPVFTQPLHDDTRSFGKFKIMGFEKRAISDFVHDYNLYVTV